MCDATQRHPSPFLLMLSQPLLACSMWTGNRSYAQNSCWGCRFVGDVVSKLPFETVLDAGTGEAWPRRPAFADATLHQLACFLVYVHSQ